MSAWWNNLVRRPLIRDIVRMAGNRNQPVPPRVFSLRSRITPETGNSFPLVPFIHSIGPRLIFANISQERARIGAKKSSISRNSDDRSYISAVEHLLRTVFTKRRMFRSSLFLNCVVLNFLVTYTGTNKSLNGYAMNFNNFCSKSFLPNW